MFLRRYERKKKGKGHVYWGLVESIRTARGPRQKVVAYLGDVKKHACLPRGRRSLAARAHRESQLPR